MNKIKIWMTVFSCGVLALPSFAQPIAVANFGSIASAGSITEQYPGYTFGQNNDWEETTGTVETIGTYWQSPDGLATVDLDGISVGAMSTTIDVATAGTVDIDFYFSGNPDGGQTNKELQVQLGSLAPDDFTFNTTGHDNSDMGWVSETASFNVTTPGLLTLSFASEDASPSDWGPVIGTVTADEVSAPDATWTILLLGLGFGAMTFCRMQVMAFAPKK